MTLADARVRKGADANDVDLLLAADAVSLFMNRLRHSAQFHFVVSGGSVAQRALPEIVKAGNTVGLDWGRLHIWFADERFAPRGHEDRNASLIMMALRQAPGFFASQLHIPAASDAGVSLDEAAASYQREVQRYVPNGADRMTPMFDLVLLGMGPDGHTASLFPGHEAVDLSDVLVAPVRNSPKPPAERVTLTYPAINSAAHVWVYATGEGKREALELARSGAAASESPVGAVAARDEVVLYADAAAIGE
ncbi:6-phosphogluconolactonase [Gulosibacter macacae]|uniref:6-phosphogluconolactonase n=1 Tax=Gulosibacter macacae TaxID=2488791 RepID=A0A3P3VWQ0_9MICO|nr:6-phosphogluconolactonase [Gulosibacter macacae]RRJ87232.1 6-phosphogluconolactonase [Gulosibacter macacae]